MNIHPVTLIIPIFNRCRVLKRAILSAVKQSYGNIEILVANDVSTDCTAEVVNSIHDSRRKLISHENSKGVAAAKNTGIKNSLGEFISFLDDDELTPDKIFEQLKVFQGLLNLQESVGACFC